MCSKNLYFMMMDYAILAAWWVLNLPYCYTSSYISVYLTWAFISKFVTFSPYLKWNFIMNYATSKLIHKLATENKVYVAILQISLCFRGSFIFTLAQTYLLLSSEACMVVKMMVYWAVPPCLWWMGCFICCYLHVNQIYIVSHSSRP